VTIVSGSKLARDGRRSGVDDRDIECAGLRVARDIGDRNTYDRGAESEGASTRWGLAIGTSMPLTVSLAVGRKLTAAPAELVASATMFRRQREDRLTSCPVLSL
jgi:hypothetical protein